MNKIKRKFDYEFAKTSKSWTGTLVTARICRVEGHCAWLTLPQMPFSQVGYLHVSQYSEDRVEDLRDEIQEGDELSVLISKFDRRHDCWDVNFRSVKLKLICDEKYPINSIQSAIISRITSYGVFLKIDDLIARIPPRESEQLISVGLIELGRYIDVQILDFDSSFCGLLVTAGAVLPYIKGDSVNAAVSHIEIDLTESERDGKKVDWVLYATTDNGGLIATKLRSWVDPLSRFKKGDRIVVEIIKKSDTRKWLYWSKIVGPSNLLNQFREIPAIGSITRATVQTVVGYGAFCTIIDGSEELLHRSQVIQDSIPNLHHYLSPGDTIEVCITNPQRQDRVFGIDFIKLISRLDEQAKTDENISLFDLEAEKKKGLRGGFVRSARFKNEVLSAFNHTCVICGCSHSFTDSATAAEAAHIVPRGYRGSDVIENALCLCKLHHWAFDRGFLTISEDGHIYVCKALDIEHSEATKSLAAFHGKKITWPNELTFPHQPLSWHRRNIFINIESIVG